MSFSIWKPLSQDGRYIGLARLACSRDSYLRPCLTLETVRFEEDPEYEAMSYTWGDPKRTRAVTVEDGSWLTSANLETGIRRLRHLNEETLYYIYQ